MVESAGPDHGQLMIQPAYNFVLAEQMRMLAKGDPELNRAICPAKELLRVEVGTVGHGSEKGLRLLTDCLLASNTTQMSKQLSETPALQA